jgi:hypothetical protein
MNQFKSFREKQPYLELLTVMSSRLCDSMPNGDYIAYAVPLLDHCKFLPVEADPNSSVRLFSEGRKDGISKAPLKACQPLLTSAAWQGNGTTRLAELWELECF